MRGAIWGDPYAIGGKRGTIPPSEPLESVFSPPQQGLPLGLPLGMVTLMRAGDIARGVESLLGG